MRAQPSSGGAATARCAATASAWTSSSCTPSATPSPPSPRRPTPARWIPRSDTRSGSDSPRLAAATCRASSGRPIRTWCSRPSACWNASMRPYADLGSTSGPNRAWCSMSTCGPTNPRERSARRCAHRTRSTSCSRRSAVATTTRRCSTRGAIPSISPNVDPGLPFEYRHLGDNSVTEGFAFLLQNLVEDREWLGRRLGISDADALLAHAQAERFVYLRRYAAKLAYELELHGGGGAVPALADRYAELLSTAVGMRWPRQTYLQDVDPSFYCACYLRAWALETHLRAYLRERFGPAWFERPEAGELLRSLWRDGQRLGADELLGELTGERLDFSAVLGDLEPGLSSPATGRLTLSRPSPQLSPPPRLRRRRRCSVRRPDAGRRRPASRPGSSA